jgi:hypothetical protein
MKKIFTLSCLLFCIHVIAPAQIAWVSSQNVATSTYNNRHPRIALDGMGNPMIIWGRYSDKALFFSRWNGSSFTMPMQLNPFTVATDSWMGPQIAAKGDTVYVVMKRSPEPDTASHIYIVRSFNGGQSFSAPVQMEFIGDSASRFPTLTVDETGNPIVAYMKFDPGFVRARWVVIRSTDYGMTFTPDVLAGGMSGGDACDCCPGAIMSSGSNVAMLYRDNDANIRDHWVGLSTDGGATFTDGWNADGNNWYLPACPGSGPDGVITGDTIHSVFMNGASGIDRVYVSKSSISSGMLAGASQLVTGTIPNLNYQNYPRIATNGSAMAVVWRQVVSSADQLPILFTDNIAAGFPAAYDTVDLANITNVDVAVGNGTVFVIWQDDGSSTVKYRKGTFTTTSVDAVNQTSFNIYPNPVEDVLTIEATKNIDGFKIVNVLGATEREAAINNISKSLKVDLTGLSTGIYFLEIKSGDKVFNKKFIKCD